MHACTLDVLELETASRQLVTVTVNYLSRRDVAKKKRTENEEGEEAELA